MKFRYKKIAPGILRPVIPIELLYEGKHLRYEALVDSGADISLVPAELGEILGIDVLSGEKGTVGGITGGGVPYYLHLVGIRIGGWAHTVEVGFMPKMPPFGYGC